jgi:DNA primase
VLPTAEGKRDPDEFARAHGRAGVEALFAAATPLSSFLIDRAVDRTCAGKPREAPLESKLAAVRELHPFVRMMPEGLARSVFEDAIAKRLDLDVAALHGEISGERPHRAPDRPPPASPMPSRSSLATVRMPTRVPVPSAPWPRALGLLVTFESARDLVAHSDMFDVLPPGEFAELARKLLRGAPPDEIAEVLLPKLERSTAEWVRQLSATTTSEEAHKELTKLLAHARIPRIQARLDEIAKDAARGTLPANIADEFGRLTRQLRDQHRMLTELERAG